MRKSSASRAPLSCAAIADAAVRLVDAKGVDALSMRNLSADLRVQAMSLYSHFKSKDELLSAITRRVMRELPVPSPKLKPEKRLLNLCRSLRLLGHAHPNIFPLVIVRPLPLDAALITTEIALRAYLDAGLSPPAAVQAQRTLLGFVRGYTLWEIGGFATGRRELPGSPARASVLGEILATDAAAFPTVHRLASTIVDIQPERDFERALKMVLDATLDAAPAKRRGPARARA